MASLHCIKLNFTALNTQCSRGCSTKDIQIALLVPIVTAILMNGWIQHLGGVALGRVCTCSLRSRLVLQKLDGYAPLTTDSPPTSSTPLSNFFYVKKKLLKCQRNNFFTCDRWQVTRDTWQLTRDTWHVTLDMWHVWGVNILSKFQLPSSYVLWVKVYWRYFHKGWPT